MKRQRLNAAQERYILREMIALETFLYAASVPMVKVNISVYSLQSDLESLLIELGINVLSVERESFLAHWKGNAP